MTPPQERIERAVERYDAEAAYKRLVDTLSAGGFTDEDGVRHSGPTLADAEHADAALKALSAKGPVVVFGDRIRAVQGTIEEPELPEDTWPHAFHLDAEQAAIDNPVCEECGDPEELPQHGAWFRLTPEQEDET